MGLVVTRRKKISSLTALVLLIWMVHVIQCERNVPVHLWKKGFATAPSSAG
jgi:hypothetical protein